MKKIYTLCIALIYNTLSYAQNDLSLFLTDALYLVDNYVASGMDISANQMASGWFHSARTKEPGVFEFGLGVNLILIPKKDKTFNVSNADLNIIQFEDNSVNSLPTALGESNSEPMVANVAGQDINFKSVSGLSLPAVGYPYMSISVGIIKNTEVTMRFTPKTTIRSATFGLFGIGVKHLLNQYHKFDTSYEPQFAVALAYNNFDFNFVKDVDLQLLKGDEMISNGRSFIAQVIGSKEFEKIEVFGVLSYAHTKFKYELGGDKTQTLTIFNELLTTIDNKRNIFKLDVGFNLKIWELCATATASIGKYPNINAGVKYQFKNN